MERRELLAGIQRVWVALVAGLALFGCAAEPPWARPTPPTPPPGAQLHGVVFDAYRAGSRSVRLSATSADVDWAGSQVLLERVRISLPGEERGPVDVQASEGRIDLGSRGFELLGGVVASTGEGERFETKALRYVPERGILLSRDPVHVKGARLELVGGGMELDVSTRRVRLLGPVRATTEPG